MSNRLQDDKILSLVRGALPEIDDDTLSSSGAQARSVLDRVLTASSNRRSRKRPRTRASNTSKPPPSGATHDTAAIDIRWGPQPPGSPPC